MKTGIRFRMIGRLLTFFILLFISGCRCGDYEKKAVIVCADIDSTLIFDGKSLNGWEITNFGPQGPVSVSDGKILLGMGDGCTGITWKKDFPVINYKVTLEAMRVQGNDFFCGMTFPVGMDACSLIIGGWGGNVTGLSSIDNKDASENETTTLQKYEKGRWYGVCLIVTNDSIKATVDDRPVVKFALDDRKMSIRPEVQLSRPFGIASWNTTAALRNIRVVRLGERNEE